MISEDKYRDLEDALIGVAIGGSVQDRTISRKVDSNGMEEGQVQTMSEHHVPANPALIEKLLATRIGGPQDWC